ncbi:hypothetical protein [Actinophytocola sp.]|uniref:hypothetical protein n=1 Tax=Actinophytocola sp. TaxID=1872138 RepID=UPI003D69FFBA
MELAARHVQGEDPERYGSGQGGRTIGQAWHTTFTMFGIPMACVLVAGRPPAGTEGIPVVIELSLADVMRRIEELLAHGDTSIVAFVHDGRTGHVVNLVGQHGDRIVYTDPCRGIHCCAGTRMPPVWTPRNTTRTRGR